MSSALDRDRARDFDVASIQLLADYLGACRLYLACLEVAYVSDREGVRDRVLRAPGKGQEPGDQDNLS